MNNFKNRKLLLFLILGAVLFAFRMLAPNAPLWITALTALALCAACFFMGHGFVRGARNVVFAALIAAVACSSLAYAAVTERSCKAPLEYADGEPRQTVATVTEVSFKGAYSASFRVDVSEVDGVARSFAAVLECDFHASYECGDIICFEGVFEEAEEDAAYLKGDGIFVRITAESAVKRGSERKGISYYLRYINDRFAHRMVELMGEEDGGFCAAIILGNRSYISSGTRLDFSRAGISHLLALSGLHLSVIAQTLDFILRGFMRKKPRNIALMVSVFAFAAFTGLSVSVLRAALMLSAVFLADMLGEENDPLTALFVSAWVILIINGSAVYDVAFLLSFSATLGIILTRPAAEALFAKWKAPKKNAALRALRSTVKYFYGIFVMSAAATFFTLPIIAFFFGEVSLIGILSNFIFLPLATALVVLCALALPVLYIPKVSAAVLMPCKMISNIIMDAAAAVSDMEGIFVSTKYPFSPYIFAALAAILFGCIFIKKLSLVKIGVIALSFAVSFSVCLGVYEGVTEGDVRVRLACDGAKEYVAMDADGESYVFDISTGGYAFMSEAVFAVKELGYTEVDNLVLTHYHDFHRNSLYRLCDVIKIRNVLLPSPVTESESEDFGLMAEMLDSLGIPYEVYVRGESYESEGVSIRFAPLRNISRSVKPIVAFSVEAGDMSFSYVEGAAMESAFDYSEFCSADAVFVGSHGPSRKLAFSARALENAGSVIFSHGAMEHFSQTEYLGSAYDIADFDDCMTLLYDKNK